MKDWDHSAEECTRVLVTPEESKELQLYMFSEGYKWNSGATKVLYVEAPIICLYHERKFMTKRSAGDRVHVISYSEFMTNIKIKQFLDAHK